MTFCRIPEKAQRVKHGNIIIRILFGDYDRIDSPYVAQKHTVLKSNLRRYFRDMSDPKPRQNAETRYYAALDLMAEGKLEEAVDAYRKSIESDPTFTEAMHGLARALQDLQRYDEAVMVAQRIAELDPDDVLAHTSLSVLYQKKGMIPEAEAEGAKARVLGWKRQLKGKS